MKITVDDKPAFTPINVVLESYDDVKKFYTLMNSSPIVAGLNISQEAEKLRNKIQAQYPSVYGDSQDTWNILSNTMKKFYTEHE
jgi:hypothetical protein